MLVGAVVKSRRRLCKLALDSILVEAMHATLGLHKGPDTWQLKQRLKADVLFHDFALPRMQWEHDSAKARFRYRVDPALKDARPPRSGSVAAPANAGTTVVWPLPPRHPWMDITDKLLDALGLHTPHTVADNEAYEPPSNAAITGAVRTAAAKALRSKHGRSVTLSGRKRTRASTSQAQQQLFDPYELIFLQSPRFDDGRPRAAPYLAAGAPVALPMAMLRSGHLHPLPEDSTPPTHLPDADCSYCGEHVALDGREPPAEMVPWLHVCHQLLRCGADDLVVRKTALYAFVQVLNGLCESENDEWLQMMAPLRHYLACCAQPGVHMMHMLHNDHDDIELAYDTWPFDVESEQRLQADFLRLILDPTAYGNPQKEHKTTLLCAVARLLRGERSTQEQERWEDAYGVCSYQYELDHGMLVKIAQLEPRDDQWQGRPNGPAMASCCAQERSQDPVGDALRAAPCCVALEGDAEVEAGCVQWGTQLDTESEDEVDLRWLRPPNMVHDTESIVPHDGAACHRVQRPTPDRVWHNSG